MRATIGKKSIILALTDKELVELQKIMLDADKEEARQFLQRCVKDKVRAVLEGEGHCKPYFKMPGQSAIPAEFQK